MDKRHKKILKSLNTYLKSHSTGEIMQDLYGDSIKALKRFDADLWKEAIENQIHAGDEELFYAKDDYKYKKYLKLFAWSNLIDEKLPWQSVDECDFPTSFLIIEDSGKRLVMTMMMGQGTVMDLMPERKFKSWMKRCENSYNYDKSKFITVDELRKIVKTTIKEYTKKFKEK